MALACFANGSLAREEIAHRFGLDWDAFADAILTRTQPGNRQSALALFRARDHAAFARPGRPLVRFG
jgi:hypothetical protein